jgi:hypothetical protein
MRLSSTRFSFERNNDFVSTGGGDLMRLLRIALLMIVDRVASIGPRAARGYFLIPSFQFEKGGQFTDMKVGYITWGKLNDAKDNALLILSATNAPTG